MWRAFRRPPSLRRRSLCPPLFRRLHRLAVRVTALGVGSRPVVNRTGFIGDLVT
jgi:hypothetical protein